MRYPPIHEADGAQAPGVVFMFAGQGSQYGGMSRDLAAHHPSFRAEYARLRARAAELGALPGGEALRRRDVRRTHVEIFLAQHALARTLVAHGVRPDYVLGVSMGEIGASVAAGVLTEREALTVVVEQARVLSGLRDRGGMLAVVGPASMYEEIGALRRCDLALASAYHFIVAGAAADLDRAHLVLRDNGVMHIRLPVELGFHSRAIDGGRDEIVAGLPVPRRPALPVVSCATGQVTDRVPAPDHLWHAIRGPIRFVDAGRALERRGRHLYLDLGPGASMSALVRHNGIDVAGCHALLAPGVESAAGLEKAVRAVEAYRAGVPVG